MGILIKFTIIFSSKTFFLDVFLMTLSAIVVRGKEE